MCLHGDTGEGQGQARGFTPPPQDAGISSASHGRLHKAPARLFYPGYSS